ncbi:kinase-like domain-containing protein [Mycena epipterygia]|nr:kinase-like domain-containing protein [Mycena epipterygia]
MARTRPVTIAELESFAKPDPDIIDPTLDLQYYRPRAEEHQRAGKELTSGAEKGATPSNPRGSWNKGTDMEQAFVEYSRARTLILETIPAHRDYSTMLQERPARKSLSILLHGFRRRRTHLYAPQDLGESRYTRYIDDLLKSWERRGRILSAAIMPERDDQALLSPEERLRDVRRLQGSDAQSCLDAIHDACLAIFFGGLHHRFILPLIGIDREMFPSSFCMVSPWMKNGTVLKYLRDRGHGDVDRLLLETAQGLEYLHAQNIVHGDLRGTNILISDDNTTTVSDAQSTTAMAASSTNHAGSVRWWPPELISPTAFGYERFLRTPARRVTFLACKSGLCPRGMACFGRGRGFGWDHPPTPGRSACKPF